MLIVVQVWFSLDDQTYGSVLVQVGAGVQYVVQLWLHCGSACSCVMWCSFGAVVVQIRVA